jgi:hypothetical protein
VSFIPLVHGHNNDHVDVLPTFQSASSIIFSRLPQFQLSAGLVLSAIKHAIQAKTRF